MKLNVATPGAEYEETLRVAELLKKMSLNVSEDSTPTVVWIYNPEDERANTACEGNLFQNEGVGLALKKFRTYRLNYHDIPNERLQKEYKNTPAFHFFDPAGKLITKTQGKKVSSLSGFSKALNATWAKSFDTKLSDYQKKMTKILDRLDRVDGRKQVLEQSKGRLLAKPNPRKQRALDMEEAELNKLAEKIAEDEKSLIASVKVRESILENEKDKDEVAKNR
jgi:hypothetical protein